MALHKNEAGMFEATIDGHVYEFGKWPAEDSLETLVDLTAVVGGSMGPAAVHGWVEGVKADMDKDTLDRIISHLVSQLTHNRATVIRLVKRMATFNVTCDGKPIVFSSHYQERMGHLFRVVRAALEVQYGNFFVDLFPGAPLRGRGERSKGTATSTGASGGP